MAQLDRVFAAADGMEVTLQADGAYVTDPLFAGRLCRTLAYTGMHISVLSGGWREEDGRLAMYQPPIDSSAIRDGFLYWRRPKNKRAIALPIKREIEPWLGSFLDQPKPRSSRRYHQLLAEVGKKAHLQVNPLRFRHTCGVILYHVLGLDAAQVQTLLGVTPGTMLTYVVHTKDQVRTEMMEKGW